MSNEKKPLDTLIKVKDTIKNLPKAFFSINLSHNTGLKMFSLILAILFWVFVMDQVDPEITRVIESVPVQLINLQELDQNNLVVMDQHEFLVNVEVTGRRNNVLNLNSSSIYLWADVRSAKKGTNVITINKTINSEAVSIQTLIPNEIELIVDQIVSIPKPVKIAIAGEYQSDLYQNGLTVSPEEVKVTGPESLVNTVAYLGGTLNVSNVSENITKEVSLVPYDNDGEMVNGVTVDVGYSSVSVNIGMNKTFKIEPVIEGLPMDGYEIVSTTVTPENVIISGNEDVINSIQSITAEPIVLKGEETSTLIVEKSLELPEGVTSNIANDTVQIEVQIEQVLSKEFTFNVKDIPIVNLSDSLSTNLSDNESTISLKVKDVESVIDNLAKTDIHLSINFGIVEKPGLYRLKVNVANEESYNELTIDPVYIEVEVTEAQP